MVNNDIKYPEEIKMDHIVRCLHRQRNITARAIYKKMYCIQHSEFTGRLLVKCCVCGVSMGSKPCLPKNDGKVSHGYCAACMQDQRRILDSFDWD